MELAAQLGQFADTGRDALLKLTTWLATSTSLRSFRDDDAEMALVDQGPLSWAPVRLSEENIEFDTRSLEAEETRHGDFMLITNFGRKPV